MPATAPKSRPVPPPGTSATAPPAAGLANLRATADLLRLAAGAFLAFQDTDATAAYDVEDAMELSAEERAKMIAALEEELGRKQEELERLNQDPTTELTAKALERNIAEIESELFALKAAQAVAQASRPPARGPRPIPWNEYANGYADRIEAIDRARRTGDPRAVERAVGSIREWVEGQTPVSPPLR
jgi:ribosomal protein L29